MAIAFARIQFVKRSAGQNACHKAAYNGRMAVKNERTGEGYNYMQKGDSAHHEVLLPEGVNTRFKDPYVLWNAVEKRETRINSQVALEGVIALPDDAQITMEDRIEIAHRAAHHFFVRHGLAVQVDIHEPHDTEDHNWHAHFLATTRTFTENGNVLGEKAREYMARYREGNLHSGEEYRQIQNDYFKEKGYDLQVDANGIVPQAHLGPVRLRARAESMMESHLERLSANQNASQDPKEILAHLTEKSSVFTREDVERYLHKHVPVSEQAEVREAFWRQRGLLSLHTPPNTLIDGNKDQTYQGSKEEVSPLEIGDTHHKKEISHEIKTPKAIQCLYTTQSVREEEQRILRVADRIQGRSGFFGVLSDYSQGKEISDRYQLSNEQLKAYEGAVAGERFVCIQGRAGTGKSHTMSAIREMIESNGIRVRGLAPTSSVAKDLSEKGFEKAQNLHKFLFEQKNGVDPLKKREVLMVDEAGMVGNTVMQEVLKLAWKQGSQVILVGDDRQLSSVDRGGMFKEFCRRYGAYELTEVRRQEKGWQKHMSEGLSQGTSHESVQNALEDLSKHSRLHWVDTKDQALATLVDQWAKDQHQSIDKMQVREKDSTHAPTSFVMEHRNRYALVLNEMIRNVRKEWGELTGTEYRCETFIGRCYVSEGDRIQFRQNDRELGVTNGLLGTLAEASEKQFVVKTDEGKEVCFNPQTFNRYQLGYAGTYHQSQGKTVDKAYALHSPHMNHNLFYVGMTRQKQDVHYVVSKDEAKDMETLVNQLSRDGSKETTLRYLTPQEVHRGEQKTSVLNKAWHYVKDAFYQNKEFYAFKDQRGQHTGTDQFRGYSVKAMDVFDQHKAIRGEEPIQQGKDLKIPKKREITAQKLLSKPLSRQKERGDQHRNSRDELDQIVSTLRSHMPEVCRTLFGDKPTQVRGHEWRYGAKGSLKVNISGPKQGGYANFETGDKGGPLHLICEAKQCTMKEAIARAKDFVGGRDTLQNSPVPKASQKDEPKWKSLLPEKDHPAPQLGEGCLEKLASHNKETARYTYTNADGDTLFHVVQLEPKDVTKEGKMTLPLSYGVNTSDTRESNGGRDDPCWALKKFTNNRETSNGLPLYNLHEMTRRQRSPILMVEGEKAAEAATTIFPEMVVSTWHGGASNVAQADISPLKGREVVVWPDNDAMGIKAMHTLAERCKDIGVSGIQMVDLTFNQSDVQLPEKWDLADALPKGITLDMLRQKVADLDLSVITETLLKDKEVILSYMQDKEMSQEQMAQFQRHFSQYPKDAVTFFKERHPDLGGRSSEVTLQQDQRPNNTDSKSRDPILEKALEADKYIRTHERHIVNCQKLGDTKSMYRFQEKLDTYKADLYKDTALWERVDTFEKGVCEHLKALKPEALKAQQMEQQKDLSRGFER